MRKAPITQKTIGINARVQETGGPKGAAGVYRKVASETAQQRDNIVAKAADNAYLQGQVVLSKDLERIESEHPTDPESLTQALQEYGDSFLDEVGDPNTRARYELQITKASQSAIARTTAKHRTIVNEQTRFNNLQAFEGIKATLPGISQGLLNPDPVVALAAGEQLQEALSRTQGIMGATDANGVPVFNASFRVNQLTDLKDTALQTAAASWIDSQPDKAAALETFEAGELTIQLPDGEGGFDTVNVRDSVSPQTSRLIQSSAKAQIAEQRAIATQQRNVLTSQLELAIETVQNDTAPDPSIMGPSAPAMSKAQKLGGILQQIDQAPAYNDTPEGIIKGNALRKKVFTKLEKEQEKFDSINAGSAFAGGQEFLNRQDPKAAAAYNDYYESIEPGLATLDPNERNAAITGIVNNAKSVPNRLTGDIQRIARSTDVDQITQAVDLIDRIGDQNPHLIGDIAPEKDLARLRMINDRVNQGYTEEEALKIVDDILDPRNEITQGEANAQLKEKKLDYRGKAMGLFDSSILPFNLGLETEGQVAKGQLDGLTAAYRVKYEDHYRITRDEKLSAKYAEQFVKGRYGVTKVNGGNQVMQFSPEKYYGIQGDGTEWMRDQMIEDAKGILKNSLASRPGQFGTKDLRENLRLVVIHKDGVTKRTAATGAPRYHLMYKGSDGTFTQVGGRYFFDPEKRKKELVDEVAKRQDVVDEFGGASLQKSIFDERKLLEDQQKVKFSKRRKERIESMTQKLQDFGVE